MRIAPPIALITLLVLSCIGLATAQEDAPMKDTYDQYNLADDDAAILATRFEDVK